MGKGLEAGTHVDRHTLAAESPGSTNAVDVVLTVGGKIVAVRLIRCAAL
jgi:hypothetical protein